MERRSSMQLGAFWKGGPPKTFLAQLPIWTEVAPVPGVWVTWLERGKVAGSQGFGVRSAGTKERVDGKANLEVASLTKQVTAHIARLLQAEGKLDFEG